jgi:thymidylate kinase
MTKSEFKPKNDQKTHIAIVGPCGSGKTTLADALKERGYDARQIAQEHSYVASMWQVITAPDILIYLDVSYQPGTRRKQLNWTAGEFNEQIRRLKHARQHCDIYVHTDLLTTDEVLSRVLEHL